jgi:hypothetical protein
MNFVASPVPTLRQKLQEKERELQALAEESLGALEAEVSGGTQEFACACTRCMRTQLFLHEAYPGPAFGGLASAWWMLNSCTGLRTGK